MKKNRECDSLKHQVELLTGKLATTEERLKQEKNKVKEVIQAQRDVRKSINASNSKRDADYSSPGNPRSNVRSSQQAPITQSDTFLINNAEILQENERLRNEKMELENSNHILRKFKRIYN